MTNRPTMRKILIAQDERTDRDRVVSISLRVPWGDAGQIEESVIKEWMADCMRAEIDPPASPHDPHPLVHDSGKGRING